MAVDFDLYGHCIYCHRNMLVESVVNGVLIRRLSPKYTEVEYILDDGSLMRVAACKSCAEDHSNVEDFDSVMTAVVKGWEHEVNQLMTVKDSKWGPERKEKYLKKYGRKKIVTTTKGKDRDTLLKKVKEFKRPKKDKPVKKNAKKKSKKVK